MSYMFVDSFLAGPGWNCSFILVLLSVQWINSWWWTEELSETCRVSWQNKFVKLVHLDDFITKKFASTVERSISLSEYCHRTTKLRTAILHLTPCITDVCRPRSGLKIQTHFNYPRITAPLWLRIESFAVHFALLHTTLSTAESRLSPASTVVSLFHYQFGNFTLSKLKNSLLICITLTQRSCLLPYVFFCYI